MARLLSNFWIDMYGVCVHTNYHCLQYIYFSSLLLCLYQEHKFYGFICQFVFSVLNVLAFVCSVFLSCNVVIFAIFFNIVIKTRGLTSHKTSFNPPFFLKYPVPNHECDICYQIVRFYFMFAGFFTHFSVSVVSLFFSYSWCVSLGFSL